MGFEADEISGGGGSQTLAQTLALGNATGEQSIISDDTFSVLNILNGSSELKYDNGAALGRLRIGAASTSLTHSILLDLDSPSFQYTTDGGLFAESWIFADNTSFTLGFGANNGLGVTASENYLLHGGTKVVRAIAGSLTLTHGTLIQATAPFRFSNLTASTVPYLDANKDITSSAITPTQLGYLSPATGNTGTGALVFGTSPTFTTDITSPKIIGGTGVTSSIVCQGSSNAGVTLTAKAHEWLVGNSGGTSAGSIYHNGNWNIGNASVTGQRLVRIGQDTAFLDIGSLIGSTTNVAFYVNTTSPSATNYNIQASAATTVISGPTSQVVLSVGAIAKINVLANNYTFTPGTFSSGSTTTFLYTQAAHTGQTASAEAIGVRFNMAATVQHATGALTTQRAFVIDAPTYSFVGASTITSAATLAITGAPIAGTNATITNSMALWVQGGLTHLAGGLLLDTGVSNNGSGFKHSRVTTGSVNAGATALVTVTWTTAFADANYTVEASVLDSTTSSLSLSVVHIESVSASAVTVRVLNNAIGPLTGTLHVVAIHD